MINAGKYNHKIKIYKTEVVTDAQGFQHNEEVLVLEPYANVKTTQGMTIIRNNSDFEKALTRFTIRYPVTEINRDMVVKFRDKAFTIEYLNNLNEASIELEMQCKEVTH